MKRQKSNLFLIALVCILVIALTSSCQGTSGQNGNTGCEWDNCPGKLLADNIAIRLEDLPPGWHLAEMESRPSLEHLFNVREEAFVQLKFGDQKIWDSPPPPRRSVLSSVTLRWDEQSAIWFFETYVPEDSVAINMIGVNEAYIKVMSTADNCTYGVDLGFRKGRYEVVVQSINSDLLDLCIEEGEEVDAEVAFVMDLATKVASRIP